MTAIDLFAGLGGWTLAAGMCGLQVLWAANHSPLAVQFHSANNPLTHHVCQDLHQAQWTSVPDHDVMLAAPSCTGHTNAKGKDGPQYDEARSTAWAVISALECKRPALCLVENVPRFRKWVLYPAWTAAVQALGYAISECLLDAADVGVPQHRVRLFLVLTRSVAPLTLRIERQAHVPVADVIGWDDYAWSPVYRPGRAQSTIARFHHGRSNFGQRFVFPYYKSGSGQQGRSLARPLGTITTRARWAVCDGDRMRMFQPAELARAMSFPSAYTLPRKADQAIHLLGNAVPPLMGAAVLRAALEAV